MKYLIFSMFILICNQLNAQESSGKGLPFSDISRHPETVNSGTIMVRLIDGLGFRYFWATEGLTDADRAFRSSGDGRSISEIMEHILQLSEIIRDFATRSEGAVQPKPGPEESRRQTLDNLMIARTAYMETYFPVPKAAVTAGQKRYDPFWNQLNGPLEDAVWHSGQIAILRRIAGNPIAGGIDFYSGEKN